MFHFFVGRALWRWFEKLAEPQEAPEQPPRPEVVMTPAAPVSMPQPPADGGDAEWVYPRVQRQSMGSVFEVYLAGTQREALVGAAEEALTEIDRLDRQLSHYRDDSDVTRINIHATTQWVRLEPRLYRLLKRCAELSEATGGAFDITAGRLVKTWGFHDGKGRVPSAAEVEMVMRGTGMNRILFDDEDHLLFFASPDTEINLGAIGKGYAIDEAVETLRFYNVERAVVHGGQSTIYALGAPPDAEGWEFVIRDPRDHEAPIETVILRDQALSTSGNYEQFFEVDGVRYSHIIDPRTGYPTQGMLSVSVIADSAADSDALSTAFYVMGAEATREYWESHQDLRVIMVEAADEGGIRVTRLGFEEEDRPAEAGDGDED